MAYENTLQTILHAGTGCRVPYAAGRGPDDDSEADALLGRRGYVYLHAGNAGGLRGLAGQPESRGRALHRCLQHGLGPGHPVHGRRRRGRGLRSAGRRPVGRRRLSARRDAGPHHGASPNGGRILLRLPVAQDALAGQRDGGEGRPGRHDVQRGRRHGDRPPALRLPRLHARLLAPLLDGGPTQAHARRHGLLQNEPLPLAPDRRPGLAIRDAEIPAPYDRRGYAPGLLRRGYGVRALLRSRPVRPLLLHRGGHEGNRSLCGRAPHRSYPRSRDAGPHDSGHDRLSRVLVLALRFPPRVERRRRLVRRAQHRQPAGHTVLQRHPGRAGRNLPLVLHSHRGRRMSL